MEHHFHHRPKHIHRMHLLWPIIEIEEEIKMLEEYKETLERELEKVKRRLETLRGRVEKRG
ncbi:MAG: DUF5320 domain-containing protein [Sulfolobales archaeon]